MSGRSVVPATNSSQPWRKDLSLTETLTICIGAALIFVATLSLATPYLSLVERFGDNSAYMTIASAICKWDFRNVFVKHFWGLPYVICAISKLTGCSVRTALLVVSCTSSITAVLLAFYLWGGWVAAAFAIINFDWYQRSFIGGSEPLFVAFLFGSFLAIRRDRWTLASLLASLATITRPLGIFLLLGIGITLLSRRDWRRFAFTTAIALLIGTLYVIPLARYFGDPLATVHSYQSSQAGASVPLFGIPFYAIIKGTILYPAPLTSLVFTFGWIFLVLAAIVVMLRTVNFRAYAANHPAEIIFAAPYLLSLYCYNYPYWARGSFPRFAIPIIPFVLIALSPWVPKDRRLLWILAPITAVLAACSSVGIQNILRSLRGG
jgi:hypothetical protein